ncbi:OsmC family protein [Agromyces allii]|uniref:OsmC family protein n=1 Tax=Agromyces allii TaxID=393607 RepID=A0ABN2Q1X4_9MICO|nr:OsmC family protein [Agromyces allii]
MTKTPATGIHHRESANASEGSVSAARTGERTFEGRNASGATVAIGPLGTPGHFSPGELLKLALAACSGMSADRVISRRLGDDVAFTVWAHGTSEPDNRYDRIEEELLIPLSALTDAEREKLAQLVSASIARSCTVGRSVEEDIDVSHEIVDVGE